ncbi:DUF927 domain-containing protein [Intestinibacter sp.]
MKPQQKQISNIENEYKYETENYLSDGNHLYKKEKDKRERICRHVWVQSNLYNIDNGKEKLTVEFATSRCKKEITDNRSKFLDSNNLMKLQDDGLDVTRKNSKYIVECIREAEELAYEKFIHSELGFSEYEGDIIYKLYNIVGRDDIKSEYKGVYDIKLKGSYDKYLDMIKKDIIGNTGLEFILATSLASILLAYIGEELNLNSMIVHLVGNSSMGKSTALRLAISCFGSPNKDKSLFGSYNSTNNALMKKLEGLKGIPYAFDEISSSNTENFSNLIYNIANGTSKQRLNKESVLITNRNWLTTIFSNGEKSIIRASNKNAGIAVRVIEIENYPWTKNAEHAEKINKIISNNYGFLAEKFAKFIFSEGKEEVIKGFEYYKDYIKEEIEKCNIKDNMLDRRCNYYALILESAVILEQMESSIKIDIDKVIELLISIEKKSIKHRNLSKSAIDFIKDYVQKYKNKFDGQGGTKSYEILGTIKDKGDYTELQMTETSFDTLLKEGGFEDKNVVLKDLKENKFLDHEKDRNTRTRNDYNGIPTKFIVIKLFK